MLTKYLAAAAGNAGVSSWLYDFASATNFWPFDVAVDSQDNVIAVGRTSEDGAGGTDAVVFKINSSGTLLWARTYGDAGENQRFNAVTVDSNDNIYVSGTTHSLASKAFWMKLDTDGVIQIERTAYDGSGGYEQSWGIQVDSSGYIYLFCELERNNGNNLYPYIILYDSTGTKQGSWYINAFVNQTAADPFTFNGAVNSDGSVISFGFKYPTQSKQIFGAWQRSGTTLSLKNSTLELAGNVSPPASGEYVPACGSLIDSSNNIYYWDGDTNAGTNTACLFKRNSSGTALDQVAVGFSNNFLPTTMCIDSNDDPYLALFYGIITKHDKTNLDLLDSIRITRTGSGQTSISGMATLSDGRIAVVGRDYFYSSGAFIAVLNIDGSSNRTYGNWTVADYSPTVSTSLTNLGSSTQSTTANSDTVSETNPSYTEAAATITYTAY